MKTKTSEFGALKKLVRKDPEYAWVLQCNLAMPIMDAVHCTHQQANMAAARIMMQWFEVDMERHEHWESLQRQWLLQTVERDEPRPLGTHTCPTCGAVFKGADDRFCPACHERDHAGSAPVPMERESREHADWPRHAGVPGR